MAAILKMLKCDQNLANYNMNEKHNWVILSVTRYLSCKLQHKHFVQTVSLTHPQIKFSGKK